MVLANLKAEKLSITRAGLTFSEIFVNKFDSKSSDFDFFLEASSQGFITNLYNT